MFLVYTNSHVYENSLDFESLDLFLTMETFQNHILKKVIKCKA